jgi:hypothetical protein
VSSPRLRGEVVRRVGPAVAFWPAAIDIVDFIT